ncbi:ferritin-like protein [Saccharothrix sp. NPDC042600]|uniref:ferritin-like domain-containing protein n=1 Tax=Saccharothrix TaxID=2071 RepID=UPI0034071F71|nr:ferritin-like protein [Saccharothrix mutabilis subsp. capreolus]
MTETLSTRGIDFATATLTDFLKVDPSAQDKQWLQQALKAAIEIEIATIPPYLCAYWSIKDEKQPDSKHAVEVLRRIATEEMYHVGHACNLLVAFGGTPDLPAAAPGYPGKLPRGIAGDLVVELECLSKDYVEKTFMVIEEPDIPIALQEGEEATTIGEFYDEIKRAILRLQPEVTEADRKRQVDFDPLFRIGHWATAIGVIELVKEEGEGNSANPLGPNGEKAHYYAFAELVKGKTLIWQDGKWEYAGKPIAFPKDVFPMARVPKGGWQNATNRPRELLDTFNDLYATLLKKLQAAWSSPKHGNPMEEAIAAMLKLATPARELMTITVEGGRGTYGPDFRPKQKS